MPLSFWTHFGSSALGMDLMWTHDVTATTLSLKVNWTMNLFGDLTSYEPDEADTPDGTWDDPSSGSWISIYPDDCATSKSSANVDNCYSNYRSPIIQVMFTDPDTTCDSGLRTCNDGFYHTILMDIINPYILTGNPAVKH